MLEDYDYTRMVVERRSKNTKQTTHWSNDIGNVAGWHKRGGILLNGSTRDEYIDRLKTAIESIFLSYNRRNIILTNNTNTEK